MIATVRKVKRQFFRHTPVAGPSSPDPGRSPDRLLHIHKDLPTRVVVVSGHAREWKTDHVGGFPEAEKTLVQGDDLRIIGEDE